MKRLLVALAVTGALGLAACDSQKKESEADKSSAAAPAEKPAEKAPEAPASTATPPAETKPAEAPAAPATPAPSTTP